MSNNMNSIRLSIRPEAERFLAEHGFSTPPLPPDQALAARKLEVAQLSLDDLLIKANLPPEDYRKIQAMLNVNERTVLFKSGLPDQKKRWGTLHEVGHEFIPWQREILYSCPLILLPAHLQEQFEAEADLFAAEAFFFGEQFHRQAFTGDISLTTAIELATDVYQSSIHATFVHYVEESPLPCCLLVWKPKKENGTLCLSGELAPHYYVKSKSFRRHIPLGQIADPEGAVSKVYTTPGLGVLNHEVIFVNASGDKRVAQAESFSNSYNVFTMMSRPVRRSIHQVT